MDIKLGTRTFLESEVSKTSARYDLYQKMIAVDPSAPTDEEHETRAVTKLRYMQFREQQSSTCSHGFRIEAMKLPGSPPITDLKTVKSHEQVLETMRLFLLGKQQTRIRLLDRLKELREKIEQSEYFLTHEVSLRFKYLPLLLHCFFHLLKGTRYSGPLIRLFSIISTRNFHVQESHVTMCAECLSIIHLLKGVSGCARAFYTIHFGHF
jgi:hypothetical protein